MTTHDSPSYLSSAASAEAALPLVPLESARSATLSGKRTRRKSSRPESPTVAWMPPQCSPTSDGSSPKAGLDAIVAEWISSLPVSPVQQSHWPGSVKEQMTTDGSGRSSPTSSETLLPGSCSSKTCRACSQPQDNEFLAYAAGIIDGEGSIGIAESKRSRRCFTPYVAVTQATKGIPILNTLFYRFGGTIASHNRVAASDKRDVTFGWRVQGAGVRCLLTLLATRLRTKGGQARLVLELMVAWPQSARRGRNVGWTQERLSEWERGKAKIQEMNRRGLQARPSNEVARLVGNRWLTPNLLSGGQWETFSGRWPTSGSMRNGVAYRQPTLVPRTDATGSGSSRGSVIFPTPSATVYGSSQNGINGVNGANRRPSAGTPSLETMARKGNWPTPRAEDSESCGANGDRIDTLTPAVRRWPTPTAGDADGSGSRNTEGSKAHAGTSLTDAVRGDGGVGRSDAEHDERLNPDWVEWLMGYPIFWTSTAPLAVADALPWHTDPGEDGSIPRSIPKPTTTHGTAIRRARLKAIGNGQIPRCAAEAFSQLVTRAYLATHA